MESFIIIIIYLWNFSDFTFYVEATCNLSIVNAFRPKWLRNTRKDALKFRFSNIYLTRCIIYRLYGMMSPRFKQSR